MVRIGFLIKWKLEAKQTDKLMELVQQLEKVKPIEGFYKPDTQIPHELKEDYEVITKFLLEEGNYRDALLYADLLFEKINPNDKVYLTWRGRALIGLKRLDEADKIFGYLISINPSDIYAYYQG